MALRAFPLLSYSNGQFQIRTLPASQDSKTKFCDSRIIGAPWSAERYLVMRLPVPLTIIPALSLCFGLFCQRANAQTGSTTKNADATISGKVTSKGKPAAGVVVGLRLSEPNQFDSTFKATSDQEGKYRITNVPRGSYYVAPVAPAFVISDVNKSSGQSLVITEGDNVEGIDFDLVKGGVITGKV